MFVAMSCCFMYGCEGGLLISRRVSSSVGRLSCRVYRERYITVGCVRASGSRVRCVVRARPAVSMDGVMGLVGDYAACRV